MYHLVLLDHTHSICVVEGETYEDIRVADLLLRGSPEYKHIFIGGWVLDVDRKEIKTVSGEAQGKDPLEAGYNWGMKPHYRLNAEPTE